MISFFKKIAVGSVVSAFLYGCSSGSASSGSITNNAAEFANIIQSQVASITANGQNQVTNAAFVQLNSGITNTTTVAYLLENESQITGTHNNIIWGYNTDNGWVAYNLDTLLGKHITIQGMAATLGGVYIGGSFFESAAPVTLSQLYFLNNNGTITEISTPYDKCPSSNCYITAVTATSNNSKVYIAGKENDASSVYEYSGSWKSLDLDVPNFSSVDGLAINSHGTLYAAGGLTGQESRTVLFRQYINSAWMQLPAPESTSWLLGLAVTPDDTVVVTDILMSNLSYGLKQFKTLVWSNINLPFNNVSYASNIASDMYGNVYANLGYTINGTNEVFVSLYLVKTGS